MNEILEKDVKNSIEVLKKGGLIIYPTDTIWGLGCDATNEKAVNKVYKVKLRHHSKSMIILVDSIEMLSKYVKELPEIAISLMQQFNKPLTIIYPEAVNLPKNVISSDGSIAIRIVKEEFCQRLLQEFKKPIVSTSANISGFANPITFKDIDDRLLKRVDYVVEYGRDKINQVKPSTIIKLKNNWEYEIIRP